MAYCHPTKLSDGLYCSEVQLWGDEAELLGNWFPLIEHDLYWDEEELVTLLSKQLEPDSPEIGTSLAHVRRDAVSWILKVQVHYDFAALTAVLAVNYLDRFLVRLRRPWWDQPWMGQLVAVACVTLAAKVEETNVPLLLDFQVEDTPYMFEAKTIKRMELLVLSTLQWKMNPVTPLSFVDYVIRRLGLKGLSCSEFLRRCENLILSLLPELKLREYLPSVVAAATMLHVIDDLQTRLAVECQSQFLGLMAIEKEKLESCLKFMLESESRGSCFGKRNYGATAERRSPRRVMEYVGFSSDSSNDCWTVVPPPVSSSSEPLFKKSRRDPSFI